MATIFISYNRQSKDITKTLVDDIKALGHTVWFDKELSGGQVWWDQILASARKCDVFVFILDPKSLNSTACKREYGYAADLGKPILPVLVAEGVSMNLLPPALSKIQFVDYRKQDREAVMLLSRALSMVPPPKPLPDPLPTPPEVPISYLGRLTEQIEASTNLSFENQSVLLVDLKRSLRNTETAEDALVLLKKLRNRRDLFAAIAMEIDELLSGKKKVPVGKREPHEDHLKESLSNKPTDTENKLGSSQAYQPSATHSTQTTIIPKTGQNKRFKNALRGLIIGMVMGVALVTITPDWPWEWGIYYGFLIGGFLAIAGAIAGTNRRVIISALIGFATGWIILSIVFINIEAQIAFAGGGVIGAPTGAIIGAIVGVILRKKLNWD